MREQATWLAGLILIVVGLALFAIQLFHLDADVIVVVIGLVFASAYATTRRYGLLVTAGILTGLGAGIVLEDLRTTREAVVLGLGLGFLAIYAVDAVVAGTRIRWRWWPLIPGAILVAIAVGHGALGDDAARAILAWPLLFIVAGAFLLWRQLGAKSGP
ncbi:MAG TPA: hypothetical protein VGQ86_10705 [Candidatus Limnocylindria bacterium]|nr:hypothetical protein [Candidatus Limnocylindria bacterium]